MAVVKPLVGLAFSSSIGLIFLIMGCALPPINAFWPLLNLIFYSLFPIPLMFAKDASSDGETSKLKEWCYFFETGIVISAFALPFVLLRTGLIIGLSCGLVVVGNLFIFTTIWGFFKTFQDNDGWVY